MLNGSYSFTSHPHVYPRMEGAILPLLRKHSPDGATPDGGSGHLIADYYSIIDPERMKG